MRRSAVVAALVIIVAAGSAITYSSIRGVGFGRTHKSSYAPMQRPTRPRPTGSVNTPIVAATNRLGLRMLSQFAKVSPGENVFLSPLSIGTALAMVYNGAGGATRDEIASVLGFSGMDLKKVNESFDALAWELENADLRTEVSVANSLWMERGTQFNADYVDRTRRFFDAKVSDLTGAPDTINEWIDNKTRGQIPAIVDRVDPDARLIIVNATYFRGWWTEEFGEAVTRDAVFHRADDTTVSVHMMHRDGEMAYRGTPGFQAVRLPYGDGRMAMYLYLPHQGVRPEDLCSRVEGMDWASSFAPAVVDLGLPRFRIEWMEDLNDTLKSFGIRQAFDPGGSDLRGIAPHEKPCISQVVHKTFIAVDEKGTEAAATDEVAITAGAAKPIDVKTVILDRPFLCIIADTKTKAVLFAGIINDPSAGERW